MVCNLLSIQRTKNTEQKTRKPRRVTRIPIAIIVGLSLLLPVLPGFALREEHERQPEQDPGAQLAALRAGDADVLAYDLSPENAALLVYRPDSAPELNLTFAELSARCTDLAGTSRLKPARIRFRAFF